MYVLSEITKEGQVHQAPIHPFRASSSASVALPVKTIQVNILSMSKSVKKQDQSDGEELVKLQALREKGKEHIRRFREYCTNDHQLQDLNRLGQRLLQQERKEQQVLVNDRGTESSLSNIHVQHTPVLASTPNV